MIEPQNTTMPLPAESAPADAPHGEAGFGEMLAQTLGMVPHSDPNAILRTLGDQGGSDDGSPETDEGAAEALAVITEKPDGQATNQHVSVASYMTIPAAGLITLPVDQSKTLPRSPIVEIPITEPVSDGGNVGISPVEAIPVPVVLDPAPRPAPPGDGIWKPGLAAQPDVETGTPTAASAGTPEADLSAQNWISDRVAVESSSGVAAQPEESQVSLAPTPAADPARPAPVPLPPRLDPTPVVPVIPEDPSDVASGIDPAGDQPVVGAEPVANTTPEKLVRKPVGPIGKPGLPIDPTPTLDRPHGAAAPAVASPAAGSEPRFNLGPDTAVRFTETGVRVPTGAAVEAPVAPLPAGTPIVDGIQPPAAAVANPAAPSLPMQSSALAERVMQAVELQANQPPPRTMVVDIPEIEGLRLVVSVRSGSEVHVAQSTSSTAAGGLQSFMSELQGVLADRGFVMTGDGRRHGSNPNFDERPESERERRPMFRRPQPTDNDLRL